VKVKIDENLGRGVAELFRRAGVAVSTVPEEGLSGAGDEAVIEVCRAEDRALVTLDLDFANPLRFPPQRYAGIVVLRNPPGGGRDELEALVGQAIAALAERPVSGLLWIVRPDRIRVYEPDLGD